MRAFTLAIIMVSALLAGATAAYANCAVINSLDRLHAIQSRLGRNPDSVMFASDIRFLRSEIRTLSDDAVLAAVGSNALSRQGATLRRFLRDTQALVRMASVDDPFSIRKHFHDPAVRRTIQAVGGYLDDLRCPPEDVQAAQSIGSSSSMSGNGSGRATEDDDTLQILKDALREIFDPTNFMILAIIAGAVVGVRHIRKKYTLWKRRRSRRYTADYPTTYSINGKSRDCVLIDISGKGTKLHHTSDKPIEPKTLVEIQIDDQAVKGTAVWSNAHYSGILFKRSINKSLVQHVHEYVKPKKGGDVVRHAAE